MSVVSLRGLGSYADPDTCLAIQCGAITQEEAGPQLLVDCAAAGYAGVRSWADPLCSRRMGRTAASVARGSQPLPVGEKAAAYFLDGPAPGCAPVYSEIEAVPYDDAALCACGVNGLIESHPLLAVLALGGVSWLVWKVRRK